MQTTCLNCGAEVQHDYCPKCGQKKDVEKLNWHSFVHEIAHFFTHIDRVFLYTSFQMIVRPGRVIKEYLAGKRKKYQKPISFYLIWAATRLLIFLFVSWVMGYENLRTGSGSFLSTSKEEGVFVVEHNQIFGLLTIPILSLLAWTIISRPRLNYIETLIVTIYVSATIEMLIALQILAVGLILQINFLTNYFGRLVQVVYSIWAFFCLMDLFKKDRIKFLFVRVLLVIITTLLANLFLTHLIASSILRLQH